jgi:hypothetical protein
LFWLPYILTETVFVCFLAAFSWTLFAFLDRPDLATFSAGLLLAGCLFFLRPVALPIVLTGTAILLVAAIRWRAPARWRPAAVAALAIFVFAALAPLTVERSREALLGLPTVSQTMWLSTTVVTGRQDELTSANESLPATDLPASAQFAYKRRAATQFIASHPGTYLLMAARRFVNFWTPWRVLEWSPRHRLVDAAVSLSLIVAALASLWCGVRAMPFGVLIGWAVLLAGESAFGQIDADARYRLPAEMLLIAPAAVTISALVRHRREVC